MSSQLSNEQSLKAFGRRVRTERLARNLSQEGLADAANLDRTYVGGVERGQRNISLLNILKIAAALDRRPAELLGDFN